MRFLLLIVFLSFLSSSLLIDARTNWPASVYSRAKQLVSQMTLDEKIQLVHGNGELGHYIGNINSISRLNIPPINLEDGPQGVADGTTLVTQWPSTLSVVSSWDIELYEKFGAAMAAEQAAKGTNILLGPMVNLARVPQGGRNFESVGEDPVIGSQYAYYLIKGIQEGGSNMMGCIKHGFFNTQEYERQSVSEIVPLRAARELYYPALQAAVDAGVGSMMCSYNRINGTYACENPNTIQWFKSSEDEGGAGFDGFVMSDWFATHSTVASAAAGLDQEMPIGLFFGEGLKLSVQLGEVSEDRLNDMVERIIRAMAATNILDNYPQGNLSANATSDEHALLAKQLAEASMVLLKNDDNLVPLDPLSFIKGGQSLVIIGDEKTVAGGGSGGVTSSYTVTPYAGIAQRLLKTPGAQSRPVNCTFYDNTDFYQPGNTEVYATDANDCCAKCSSIAECNYFTFSWPNSCWIKFSDEGKRESLGMTAGSCSPLPFRLSYNSGVSNITDAVIAAKNNDYVVVVVATTSQEGSDRPDLSLGNNQDQLVEALIEANPNTIVIVRSAGAVTLPWANKAKTIFWQGMSGQESGNAIASVLFGDINPSGRLPLSFPSSLSDTWLTTTEQYPGVQGSSGFLESHYTEELLIGYRWYDAKNISPAFIFGHGLSYTTFNYHSLSINGAITSNSDITISLSITNTGKRDGDEIIQYYIAYPDNAGEPPKVLRRFQKQFISAGKTITIQEKLSIKDVQIFDVTINNWKQIKGTFKLLIGASSTDIRASADFQSN